MPEIRSFRGLRYDQDKVNLSNVVAPPYDVISAEYQDELYARSPYNVIRLILGRSADRYQEAATCLEQWKQEGILRREHDPALYVLAQTFRGPDGGDYCRTGFIAACRLEDFSHGIILPHERTHSKPKEDRFRLIQATKANFSQIFGLYSDHEGKIDGILRDAMHAQPLLSLEFEGVSNRLWVLADPVSIDTVKAEMRDKVVLIADGHHRYETALAYRDLMRLNAQSYSGEESSNYTMMFFANMESEGLVIFPTHRLLHHLSDFHSADFFDRLGKEFTSMDRTSESGLLALLAAGGSFAFGVVTKDRWSVICLKHKERLAQLVGELIPPEVRELDVTLLHSYILERLMGINAEAQGRQANVEYVKDPSVIFDAVRRDSAQVAFLMNPTRIEQVRRVARAGHTMPQKSTYFYPKLVSGFVINPLE